MKALVYEGAKILKYRDFDILDRKDNEVKIQIQGTGICGSDLHAFLGHDKRRIPPMILGHEIFGKVIEGDTLLGSNVTLNPIVSCGNCKYCLQGRDNICPNRHMVGMNIQGGFAQFININKKNIVAMNSDIDIKIGALAEPLANAIHVFNLIKKNTIDSLEDMRILIIGAGSIGLLCAIIFKYHGCKDITVSEINPIRKQNINDIYGIKLDVEDKSKYNVVIDAVGIEPTRNMAMKNIAVGGTFMHIGLGNNNGTIDFRKITLDEISFLGTYAYTHKEFMEATNILNSKVINYDLGWIEESSLKNGQKAFESIINGATSSAKIVLTM